MSLMNIEKRRIENDIFINRTHAVLALAVLMNRAKSKGEEEKFLAFKEAMNLISQP